MVSLNNGISASTKMPLMHNIEPFYSTAGPLEPIQMQRKVNPVRYNYYSLHNGRTKFPLPEIHIEKEVSTYCMQEAKNAAIVRIIDKHRGQHLLDVSTRHKQLSLDMEQKN